MPLATQQNLAVMILAPHRSGSTLLDNLIGGHPGVITLGEVDKLRAYALNDRRYYDPKQPLVCTCGVPVGKCEFWQHVETQLGRPLSSLALKWPLTQPELSALSPTRRFAHDLSLKILWRRASLFRSRQFQKILLTDHVGSDSWQLYDAVSRHTQVGCIVDASKEPFRYRSILQRDPDRVRTIILCRDYRGVTCSLMKRGVSLEKAALRWKKSMEFIEEMARDVPRSSLIRIHYESLCDNPAETLASIWNFLGLKAVPAQSRRSVLNMHHIAGSPSKFSSEHQLIKADDAWKNFFSKSQLEYLKTATAPYSTDWGYE